MSTMKLEALTTLALGSPNGIGKNGNFGGQITVMDGTFDTNGMVLVGPCGCDPHPTQ